MGLRIMSGESGGAPESPASPPPTKKRRRGLRIALACLAAAGVVIAGAGAGLFLVANHLSGNIQRIPNVFRGVAHQPVMPAASSGSVTILLAGSDIRSPRQTTGSAAHPAPFDPGEQRSDVLMLVHITANRKQVSFISIPRDSWVDVPGIGKAKINAALSLGGPPLMIKTVEQLTHVRINHYAVLDFRGFVSLVGALGGVGVRVAHTTSSRGVTFHQGFNRLTPSSALIYVRQRYGLPLGDLNRVQRQQNLIRTILAQVAARGVLSSPFTMYRFLSALTHSISVDSTFTNAAMLSLANQLKSLPGRDFTFLTAPWRGFGTAAGQSVVYLNQRECGTLWQAVRHDSVAAWAKRHPATLTPATPY
jgi:LCP family protein required for cell wall assembly